MLGMCKSQEGGLRMSLYSEWKMGLLDDYEYSALCKREDREDRDRNPGLFEDTDESETFDDDEIDEF